MAVIQTNKSSTVRVIMILIVEIILISILHPKQLLEHIMEHKRENTFPIYNLIKQNLQLHILLYFPRKNLKTTT